MIQGYAIPNATMLGNNGAYKSQFYKALEGAKAAGATVEEAPCLLDRGVEAYNDGLPFTPSLLIVPQFYKAGNLYQDVPPFVAEDSTMRFTVSRNTTATRVNSSGLIVSVASGVPRIDWLGQSCPGLLVEASGQNLALQSEAFNVSGTWVTTTGGTGVAPIVTQATGIVDPAGGTTAERIQLSVGSGTLLTDFSILRQTATFTAVAHTFSVYLRSATSASQFVAIRFNSAPQTILEITPSWQRFTFTGTPSAGSRDFGFDLRGNNTSASGSADFYAWGAQVEVGSIATTYIPTTTTTASRAADDISASGALVSGLIGQTEGTIYAEVDLRNWIASGRILTCSNGTSDERIMIQVGANRTLQAIVTTASADVANISTASGQVNGVYKCALTYASGDFAFYVNGTQIGTDSSGGVPACTSVFLGKIETSASTNFLNDRIRAAALYTTRLSNAQLAELTRL